MKMDGFEGEFPSPEEVKSLHDRIIEESKFDDDKGYLDESGHLFEGAYYHMFAGFGGVDAFPSIIDKAARLCYNIITNHVFKNANKRTGLMVLLVILDLNLIQIQYNEDDMFNMISRLGNNDCSYEEFVGFIKSLIVGNDEFGHNSNK